MCEGDNGGDSAPTSLLLVNQISAVFFLVLISERIKKLENYKKILCFITADTPVPSLTTRNAYFTNQHLKAVFL